MRTGRRGAALAVALLAAAAAAPAGDGGSRAAITLRGTVTLAAVDITKQCRFSAAGKTLVALCLQNGTYTGVPGPAGAAYSWRWDLEVGANGSTTGRAPERGELALNFGRLGLLRLTTSGRQVPVGTPTKNAAKGRTTGTWTMKSGTKGLAGRHGSGTYVFETARTGQTTFQVARLVLQGAVR